MRQNLEHISTLDSKIPIKILCKTGLVTLNINAAESLNAKVLKQKALKELLSFDEHITNDFVLIRIKTKQRLSDTDKLSDINKNEEFLLVASRRPPKVIEHIERGPSTREILLKTNHLPSNQPSNLDSLNILQSDLQNDLRRLILEIANESTFILSKTAYATKLINYFRQKIAYSLGETQTNLIFSKQLPTCNVRFY